MNTPETPDARYMDLARAGASIKRPVRAVQCERLANVVQDLADGQAELEFHLTDDGEIAVNGLATMRGAVECHLCMRPQTIELRADITGLIVETDTAANEDQANGRMEQSAGHSDGRIDWDAQPLMVSKGALNIAELVEDELLLQIPSRVCVDVGCPHRPDMDYGEVRDDAEQERAAHPFAQLAQLRGRTGREE